MIAYSVKAFLALFVALTPFVGVSAFAAFSAGLKTGRERARIALKTTIAVAVMMLLFLVAGDYIFRFFGISSAAFQIAGGIVIIGNGLSMVRARAHEKYTAEEASEGMAKEDFSVVPLATPILCGPATISTVIILAGEAASDRARFAAVVAAIAASSLAIYALLVLSADVARLLGQTGMNVLTRVMGLLFAALGVEVVIRGLTALGFIRGAAA